MNPFKGKLIEATEAHVMGFWGGRPRGEGFLCGLCGHKFEVGEMWRGVMANRQGSPCIRGNFLVCETCHDNAGGRDEPLLEQRAALEREAERLDTLGVTPHKVHLPR